MKRYGSSVIIRWVVYIYGKVDDGFLSFFIFIFIFVLRCIPPSLFLTLLGIRAVHSIDSLRIAGLSGRIG